MTGVVAMVDRCILGWSRTALLNWGHFFSLAISGIGMYTLEVFSFEIGTFIAGLSCRMSREVVRWALRQLGVEEWLVQTVMTMYERARTVVRTKQGYSTEFEVKVGVHQGSVLSPLLFVAMLEVVTRGVKEGLPWELLYTDDLVLVAQSKEELREKVL